MKEWAFKVSESEEYDINWTRIKVSKFRNILAGEANFISSLLGIKSDFKLSHKGLWTFYGGKEKKLWHDLSDWRSFEFYDLLIQKWANILNLFALSPRQGHFQFSVAVVKI